MLNLKLFIQRHLLGIYLRGILALSPFPATYGAKEKRHTPNVELEPTTLRLRVSSHALPTELPGYTRAMHIFGEEYVHTTWHDPEDEAGTPLTPPVGGEAHGSPVGFTQVSWSGGGAGTPRAWSRRNAPGRAAPSSWDRSSSRLLVSSGPQRRPNIPETTRLIESSIHSSVY